MCVTPPNRTRWPRAWGRFTRRLIGGVHHDTDGLATIEFVLVFPVALFVVLVLLQTTLLMAGNVFVHYAAYAATRTAITRIGADQSDRGGDGRNRILASPGDAKFDAIKAAAVFAVAPVSGQSDRRGDVPTARFVAGLEQYLTAAGRGEPNWVRTLIGKRLNYAAANTDVTIYRTQTDRDGNVQFSALPAGAVSQFGPRDPITVGVEHRLALTVPYVWRIFADGDNGGQPGDGGYTNVHARYTLTNLGVDPALPPEPALPRVDN